MALLEILFQTVVFLAQAVIDALLGRRRKRYVAETSIKAPLEIVWNTVSAPSITLEGAPRIEVTAALRPGTSDVYEGTFTHGNRVIPMAYREVSRQPPNGLVIQFLADGTDPAIRYGDDYYATCALTELPDGVRLSVAHELTHTSFKGRVLVPLGALLNLRRMRFHCETLAGTSTDPTAGRLGAAILTGLLTYASFIYLFDGRLATILLALLILHEAGHALAMRWVGLPVHGIYFIPFFGGVAVASAPHRTEGERGFIALMGSGFSLFTTAGFLIAAALTGEILFKELAFASAALNVINLAPVLPLDGGHVVDAAMSRGDPEVARIINVLALLAGAGATVYFQVYELLVLLALTVPIVLRSRPSRGAEPISSAGRNWLLTGYLGTLAFYIATIAHLLA